MILPSTFQTALMLTILAIVCWSIWPSTFKLAGKWRFELFYFDFTFGAILVAAAASFTLGSMGEDLTFLDNIAVTRSLFIGYAIIAGTVFNLGHILLVGGMSLAGMSVAFPIAMGLSLVVGVLWSFLLDLPANPVLLLAGTVLVLLAVIVNAKAYRAYVQARRQSQPPLESTAPVEPANRRRSSNQRAPGAAPRRTSIRAIVVSVAAGLLMGSFYPLIQISREGELGLGPYAAALIFTIGIFISTLLYNMILMNLPLRGEPIEVIDYFRGSGKSHVLGLGGGMLWCTGVIAYFVATSAPPHAHIGPALSVAAIYIPTLVTTLLGILVWKEFSGASSKLKGLLALMMLLLGIGLASVSLAPLHSTPASVNDLQIPSESGFPILPENPPNPAR